jgi:4-amino-4-deoxy-L-arabinose transferase-like glycosyltransferase
VNSVATESRIGFGNRLREKTPSELWSTFQNIVGSRLVAWTVFTILYAVPTVRLARVKLFWDDEFFTLYISRASGWHDLLRALATGADQHPPTFYFITHLITSIFGTSHVTVRLTAILGFWLLCICLYEIIRDIATPEWAVVAMLFPLATKFYYYASEARGYGLVCGFIALAVLSWLRSASNRNRILYVPLLGVALAGAVASHYYAILVVIPLALGELVRTRYNRKVDFPIWIAFTGACIPVLAFLGTIRSARGYSTHFWAVPVWSDAITFYPNEFGLGAWVLLGMLVIPLSHTWFQRNLHDAFPPSWRKPAWSAWQATAIYALCALPLLTMVVAKFVTHAFTPRYAISAIVGVTVLIFYFVSRLALRRGTAAIGIIACVSVYLLQVHLLQSRYKDSRVELQQDITSLSAVPDAPIAVMEISVAHGLSFYAPRRLASRVVYIADPNSAISYLGQDTVDRGFLDLRPWFPIDIIRPDSFLADNHQFYVFGMSGEWSWLTFDMSKWGQTKLLARGEQGRLLFSVDHVHGPGDSAAVREERAIQSTMLFATLPREGPSLCVLYMGQSNCP